MHLGRVIGAVHATVKDPNVETATMLVVQPLDARCRSIGTPLVAVDMVGAGRHDVVCYVTAYEAVMPWKERRSDTDMALIDAGVVAILDRVDGPAEETTS